MRQRAEHASIRGQMIAMQEELDWESYWLYGLLTKQELSELRADLKNVPELRLGERAFEITMAPEAVNDEGIHQWFVRHGSTPITEIQHTGQRHTSRSWSDESRSSRGAGISR